MNDYEIYSDLEAIKALLEISTAELADELDITPMTINRWKNGATNISEKNAEAIYDFAFGKGIHLNKIKEQLFREDCAKDRIILFHGAKTCIDGPLSIDKSKENNDFGKGFYCGESMEQSAMFVSGYQESSLYILEFDNKNLRHIKLNVDRDWMLLIAYFRGKLNEYSSHPIIKELLLLLKDTDYIIAPIADNRMFEIIDSFIAGEITDVQCRHCLSATNLGNQYVFVTQRALDKVKILRHCYLSQNEKQFYLSSRQKESVISNDKVKLARIQFRGQGKYIEEIFE